MKKRIAAVCAVVSLSCFLTAGNMEAQESETQTQESETQTQESELQAQESESQAQDQTAAQDDQQQTGEGQTSDDAASAETEIAKIDVPQTRPEYDPSDYVNINNESYIGISVSVYPPSDDSQVAQTAWQEEVDRQIMSRLFALYPVESYPEELLDYTAGNLIETYRSYAEMYGMDFSSFLQTYLHMDEETFQEQVETAAKQTLTEEIILSAIARKQSITVSDEEYEQGCANYAAQYGYDSADSFKQTFDEQTIRVSLLMDKTFDYLESAADIQLISESETEAENAGMTETDNLQ